MKKINTYNGYEYWIGIERDNRIFYNITKTGAKKPDSGYFEKDYILQIKKVPDLFPAEEFLLAILTS